MDLAAIVRTAINTLHKIILFQNNIIVGTSTVLADLTEADFSGYVRKTATFLPPYIDPLLGGSSFQQTVQWDFDDTTPPLTDNIVYGFAIIATPVAPAPEKLLAVSTFDDGISMATAGDSLPLTVKLNYGRP